MNIEQKILETESARWKALIQEIEKKIIGQTSSIEKLCIGLLCNGHILLEGVPGLAKTTLIKTLATTLGIGFSRIQFTPDLLP
ncbi:MAG TPA: AAA family ATPase, partial [Candidatus Babeliales bacterium]|nr:AAA family ATPase [Candidatus Babeliales bacterium]